MNNSNGGSILSNLGCMGLMGVFMVWVGLGQWFKWILIICVLLFLAYLIDDLAKKVENKRKLEKVDKSNYTVGDKDYSKEVLTDEERSAAMTNTLKPIKAKILNEFKNDGIYNIHKGVAVHEYSKQLNSITKGSSIFGRSKDDHIKDFEKEIDFLNGLNEYDSRVEVPSDGFPEF